MSDTPPQEPVVEQDGETPEGPPFSFMGDPGDNVPSEVLNEFRDFFDKQEGTPNDATVGSDSGGSASDPTGDSAVEGEPNGEQPAVPTIEQETDTSVGERQDGEPAGGHAEAGDQGAGTGEGEEAPPVESESFSWVDGEYHQTFDADTVKEALVVLDWARQLPDEARAGIAAVTDGTAIPIPRADYEAFRTWQQQQNQQPAPTQDRDADLRALDLDPEAMAVFQKTRDELDALKAAINGQQQQQYDQPDPAMQQTVNSNMDATAQAFDRALVEYGQQRGMTEQELTSLAQEMINMNIIPSLSQSMATVNPVTRQVIAPAPVSDVVSQAMDTALYRNPTLWESLMTRGQSAATAEGSTPPNPALASIDDAVITSKKARASSVASAPSATTTPVPRQISQLGNQEVTEEIAKYLDQITTG